MSRDRVEPDWLFRTTNTPAAPAADLPRCSYDDHCIRAPYDDTPFCKLHKEVVEYRQARARAHPHVCTCIAGDGAAECDRLDDCLEAWRQGRMVRL